MFDEGKPRPISAFTEENRGSVENRSANVAEPDKLAPTHGDAATQSLMLPEHITVLLFDDMHLTFEDMTYVQKAASNALDGTC